MGAISIPSRGIAGSIEKNDFVSFKKAIGFSKPVNSDPIWIKKFCNGRSVQETEAGICCDLELKTPGNNEKQIFSGNHRVGWVAPLLKQAYINIEVRADELANNEVHQVEIRCANRPPTWETIAAAFGSLMKPSSGVKSGIEKVPFDPRYKPAFRNNQEADFLDSSYAILTHANPLWDYPRSTEVAIKKILKFSADSAIKSIGLTSSQARQPYFFNGKDVTYIAQSEAGQFRFNFPNAKNFIFGGGNLKLCLCESIRDAIAGSVKNKIPLNMFIVTDAVFDRLGLKFAEQGWIEDSRGQDGKFLRQRYSFPLRTWENDDVVKAMAWAKSVAGSFLLDDLFNTRPRAIFLNQIKDFVLRTTARPARDMCIQNSYNQPKIDRRLTKFEIFDRKESLYSSSEDSSLPFTVRLIFVNSTNLRDTFAYWRSK